MNKINLAVFFGGESLESEISIITGKQVLHSLNKTKYNIYPIFIDKNGIWWHIKNFYKQHDIHKAKMCKVLVLMGNNYFYFNNIIQTKIKIHCAINCIHGGFGESGALNEMLKQCNIPVTSSNLNSGLISLNKYLTKLNLSSNGLSVLPYILVTKNSDYKLIDKFISKHNYPFVVKPISMGSSIGVNMVNNKQELIEALNQVFALKSDAIIEQGIAKVKEYNCACFQNREKLVVSEVEKPIKKSDILTYAEKYGSKGCKVSTKQGTKSGFASLGRQFPAKISESLKHKIQSLTKQAYTIFNCSGVIRCDYIYYNRKLYLNEINSVPGSLAFYLFEPNTSFTTLLDNLITTAIMQKSKK